MATSDSEDIVGKITGNFGKWQLRTLIFIFMCKIPATWFMACISYTAPVPQTAEYFCIPAGTGARGNGSVSVSNETWIRKSYHPKEVEQKTDREFYIDQCYTNKTSDHYVAANYTKSIPNQSSQQVIIPCDHFEHNADYESLVTQFDLVCSREMLVSLTQAFHALGGLVGGLMALYFLQYTSPKSLMLYGMIGQIICGNITGLVSTFSLHVYYRWLTSVFCAFMHTSGQVIMSDITAGKARTIAITLSELFASIGLILLPGVAMFFDSWSSMYVAISTSLLPLIIPHRWICDSPRWLLKHNQIDETVNILLESAAVNNRDIPLDLETRLHELSRDLRDRKPQLYWTIWDGRTPRRFIALLHWAWSVSVVLYTVMILMIRLLGVKYMHVNTFCLGFSEILGIFLGLYLILYTRRRWLWSGCLMMVAGVTTYFIWFSPNKVKESRKAGYELIFWLILKLVNSASLVVLTACSGELVRPEKRPILMLSTGCFSRFWLTVVPFTLVLGKIHYLIPMTMFATAAVTSGAVMCYLNGHLLNDDQPKSCLISTPQTTYRKRSSSILLRKFSSVRWKATLT